MSTLSLKNISVSFGEVDALMDVSLDLPPGAIQLLAGPNGSGKSTLIRVLLGLIAPQKGGIYRGEQRISVDRAFKSELGYLPESVAFSENLTGQQVVRFFGRARGVSSARVQASLERVGLQAAKNRTVRGYSRGMRQRLGLAVSIVGDPDLLILDEPTGGLDQEGLGVLWDVLTEWRERGRRVLVASHDLALMERRVDSVCLLRAGQRLALASPNELRLGSKAPVRVYFDCQSDEARSSLLLTLSPPHQKAATKSSDRQLIVEVLPHDLLQVLELSSEAKSWIVHVRVAEPGLDVIYDQLLLEAEE